MARREMNRSPALAQLDAESVDESESLPARRPFGVTLLLWLVLSLSAWGLLRLAAALRWWDVLERFGSRLGPLYFIITGSIWVLAGLVLLWSIWSAKRWAYLAIPISVILWLAEYWIERLFFETPRPNWVFAIIASAFFLAVTWVSASNRTTRKFLTKSEEHEQSNEDSASA
jgi:hypothetical protein